MGNIHITIRIMIHNYVMIAFAAQKEHAKNIY